MEASGQSTGDIQLPINLFTRNPAHSIPSSTYLLPSSWRRFQLSSLINKVLSPTAPIPFDFIVDGELLRGTLDSYIKSRRGGDTESTLNVEYVESLMPPKEQGSFPQDDWVSGVSIQRPGYILLSSYLSHAKIIPFTQSTSSSNEDANQDAGITLSLPTSLGATCASWLSPDPSHSAYSALDPVLVGAGGVDRQAHIFSLPSSALTDLTTMKSTNSTPEELMTLHLHTGPISTISPSFDYSKVLTSSWDGLLGVFSLPTSDSPLEEKHDVAAEPSSYLTGQDRRQKRRKVQSSTQEGAENGLAAVNAGGWRKSPETVLSGHKGRIGGALWDHTEQGQVWSAGWDGSVRGWDAEMGGCKVVKVRFLSCGVKRALCLVYIILITFRPSFVQQGPQERAALCIAQMAGSGSLATGHMDRVVCLWDARECEPIQIGS